MKSLDPRVVRLPLTGKAGQINPKVPYDQFGTFEVFVQSKEGKLFQHEGIVHAPDLELAYVLAKETFTRRFTCNSLYVAETRNVFVSLLTEGNINVYDLIESAHSSQAKVPYEIYHLPKRGKQHIYAGSVMAGSPEEAMSEAKEKLNQGKVIYNVWAIAADQIRFTTPEDQELWITLPEKKYRDAAEYKGGDKLNDFLNSKN